MALRGSTAFRTVVHRALATVALSLAGMGAASGYVGPSFMHVPGVAGGWQGASHKNWVKLESHSWATRPDDYQVRRRLPKMFYSAPFAPRQGASTIAIAVDKRSPALAEIMRRCRDHEPISELTYAESSMRARYLREIGPRPTDVPEYYEYKLKGVQFSDCPVVADAPEQAIVVSFKDIEWLNYPVTEGEGREFTLPAAALAPVTLSGRSRTFVVTWFAVANDVAADQCSSLNAKPVEADYYAFMSSVDAASERAQLAGKGGVNYEDGSMELRGPNKQNVCKLPGIVRDPGMVAPQSPVARGLNLDSDDGSGPAPARTCKHRNYAAADGRTGIDNQLFTVQGCIPGHQGHKGFLMQYRNEQRRNGLLSMLVQVSGIDDEMNDDQVDVTLLYSKDPMAKNASGSQILSDYTFRVTDNPEYTHYFARLPGRIANGVVTTGQVAQLQVNPAIDSEVTLFDAAMRLEFLPDGTLKGVLGGYEDWRRIMALNSSSNAESLYGFQCPSLYNALKRAADGLRDPVTDECNGISAAYDIEGIPAFIPPMQQQALTTQVKVQVRQQGGAAQR